MSRVEAPSAAETYRFVPITATGNLQQTELDGKRIGAIRFRTGKSKLLASSCITDSGYVDGHGELFLACAGRRGETEIHDVQAARTIFSAPAAGHFRLERNIGMHWFPPGGPTAVFENPDVVAVGPAGDIGVLRLASAGEPATSDDPAWSLSAQTAPLELAPWSTIELATSPACARSGGYRAIVQTVHSWIDVEGSTRHHPQPGMTALVRWSTERVCLEAIEVPMRQGADAKDAGSPTGATDVMLVARFVGAGKGAALLTTSIARATRDPVSCELVKETTPASTDPGR